VLEKSFCKTPRIWAMVVQETICWPNLSCAIRRAVCRSRSRIHSDTGTGSSCSAMTQHCPTTSAAAVVWASGPSVGGVENAGPKNGGPYRKCRTWKIKGRQQITKRTLNKRRQPNYKQEKHIFV